jgi:hypothetical protein
VISGSSRAPRVCCWSHGSLPCEPRARVCMCLLVCICDTVCAQAPGLHGDGAGHRRRRRRRRLLRLLCRLRRLDTPAGRQTALSLPKPPRLIPSVPLSESVPSQHYFLRPAGLVSPPLRLLFASHFPLAKIHSLPLALPCFLALPCACTSCILRYI